MTQKKATNNTLKIADFASWICVIVLGFLPFSTLITTWLGSNFAHLDLFRIWKELIIFGTSFLVFYIIFKDKKLSKELFNDNIIRLIVFYIILNLVLGFVAISRDQVNSSALVYGLLTNLRFFGIFIITFVLAKKSNILRKTWQKILLIPAMIVVSFGLLQQYVLPFDFLKHFGYGDNTIIAYNTVDEKLNYFRIQSTLRGPNPLGAYLLLTFTALVVLIKKYKDKLLILLGPLTLLAIFYTYSRSAWIGLSVSIFFAIYWIIQNKKFKRTLLLITIFNILMISGLVWLLRDNNFVQNTVFHTDETSKSSQSSNFNRSSSQFVGFKDIVNEPYGRGVGTAGPASTRNDNQLRIAENYYIQITQEVGILGLLIFVMINILVGIRLFKQKNEALSLILIASLIGVTVVNLLSHAWADETLGLIWWGLAGIALSTPLGGGILLFKGHSNDKK